jgi:hypothetical protein
MSNQLKIMKLKFISILALIFAATMVFGQAQKPISVAILDFDSPQTGSFTKNFVSLVTADLASDSRLSIVERSELEKILKEQAIGLGGETSPDTAARIGKLTGAKVLVTGRIFNPNTKMSPDKIIIANIIGVETGRVFAETLQGERTNATSLASMLSQKIAQTIIAESTNLIASASDSREQRIQKIIESIKGQPRPAVSVKVAENFLGNNSGQTVQNELGLIFQKAGFVVVDENSEQRPDIIVTGEATASGGVQQGNLFSSSAEVEVQAQERVSGKIIAIARQRNVALDIGKETAAKMALQNATDELAERLLPLLAQ